MAMQISRWITVALLGLTGCTEIGGGPTHGRVVEKTTGQPVEGALVIVKWNVQAGGWGGPQRAVCTHIESARTDATGAYHVAQWTVKLGPDSSGNQQSWLPFTFPHSMDVAALKPGYMIDEALPLGAPKAINLTATKFPGTETEWLAEWEKRPQFDGVCSGGGGSRTAEELELEMYRRLGHTQAHKDHIEALAERLITTDYSKGWLTHPDPKPVLQKNQ